MLAFGSSFQGVALLWVKPDRVWRLPHEGHRTVVCGGCIVGVRVLPQTVPARVRCTP